MIWWINIWLKTIFAFSSSAQLTSNVVKYEPKIFSNFLIDSVNKAVFFVTKNSWKWEPEKNFSDVKVLKLASRVMREIMQFFQQTSKKRRGKTKKLKFFATLQISLFAMLEKTDTPKWQMRERGESWIKRTTVGKFNFQNTSSAYTWNIYAKVHRSKGRTQFIVYV